MHSSTEKHLKTSQESAVTDGRLWVIWWAVSEPGAGLGSPLSQAHAPQDKGPSPEATLASCSPTSLPPQTGAAYLTAVSQMKD